ncbi:hypothetical protein [Asaia prunellae]|uniref:hypothetical protein n=1 Tax=Asaia prunellae TaxID=610245 RepID=UPI000472C7DE|nr:hypothetical protein [Asaia prunellae]
MAVLRDRDVSSLQATDRKTLYDTGIASGTARDFARRLRLLLPAGWFPAYRGDEAEDAPILQALLTGFGSVLASTWTQINSVRKQTRFGTTEAVFLDMTAADFFGPSGMPRLRQEKDSHFRKRMVRSLGASLNTRTAISEIVHQLSGAAPRIIEPGTVHDCGAWRYVGGYGAARSRYGTRPGGQFFLEVYPKLPAEPRVLHAALRGTKAADVIAWVRMQT